MLDGVNQENRFQRDMIAAETCLGLPVDVRRARNLEQSVGDTARNLINLEGVFVLSRKIQSLQHSSERTENTM